LVCRVDAPALIIDDFLEVEFKVKLGVPFISGSCNKVPVEFELDIIVLSFSRFPEP
jgi:hypothetical protein